MPCRKPAAQSRQRNMCLRESEAEREWVFCAMAAVLVLSLVSMSPLRTLNDPWDQGVCDLAPLPFWSGTSSLHCKGAKGCNTILIFIGYRANKNPKKKQLTRWLTFWCWKWWVADTPRNNSSQWPCCSLWSRVRLSTGRLIHVKTAQKAKLASAFAWSVFCCLGIFPQCLELWLRKSTINH